VDLSNGFKFVTRSCANTKETIKMDDGRELPLFKLDTSSESHPSTPARRNRWTTWAVASRSSATAPARSLKIARRLFRLSKGSTGNRAALLLAWNVFTFLSPSP
jgi:hypothetical protein